MKAVGGLRRPPHVAAVASLEHARLIDDPSGSAAEGRELAICNHR